MRCLFGCPVLGEDKKEIFQKVYKFSAVGLEMGLSVVIGLLMGLYLDKYFKTQPWLTILFLIFGIGAAFKAVLSAVRKGKLE